MAAPDLLFVQNIWEIQKEYVSLSGETMNTRHKYGKE